MEFRKRLTDDIFGEINEKIIEFSHPDEHTPAGGGSCNPGETSLASDGGSDNKGTLMPDANCASQHIAFPQDINLLNEVRENLESIIDKVCYEYNEPKPGYIDRYLEEGKELDPKQEDQLAVIRKVYEQQKYMYDNNAHSAPNRISYTSARL